MGKEKNVNKILVGKPNEKRPLRRARHRREHGFKMDLTDTSWDSVEWILLVQDRDQLQALVNMVINLQVLAPQS
jgi:hypothetical protein